MASTYSSSLRLELMATGDQSGTWGDTTNTNLGTLLEQAITGYLSVAQGDVANLTLTTVNGGSDQARNAIVNVTGALTAQRNVVVQTANKLYLIKNATTGGYSIVVKTASGTGVTIANGASRWVYSDGTNVVDGQFGPLLPSSNDGGALGSASVSWSDLFLASGAVINIANGDWVATHTTGILTVGTGDLRVTTAGTNAASAVTVGGTQTLTNKTMTSPVLNTPTVGTSLLPTTDDGAPLGSTSKEWSDLFLASGGVINWANGDVTITHSSNALAFAGANNGYTWTTTGVAMATFTSTDAGAGAALFALSRDSASPAAFDTLCGLRFNGRNDAAGLVDYGDVYVSIISPTAGAESSNIDIYARISGTGTSIMTFGPMAKVNQSFSRGAPVTKAADFTVAANENWLINNKSGSTCTVTLPAASSYSGREIMFKNIQAQQLVSASSNVVPLGTTVAGTAILSANAGRWATLVSDGTNWVIMAGVV